MKWYKSKVGISFATIYVVGSIIWIYSFEYFVDPYQYDGFGSALAFLLPLLPWAVMLDGAGILTYPISLALNATILFLIGASIERRWKNRHGY